MAKHPHRLLLVNKKTWRCTLEGCAFFVHVGLAYVLPGKSAVCWECGEVYTLDEHALKDDMPKCGECRGIYTQTAVSEGFNLDEYMAQQLEKRKIEQEEDVIEIEEVTEEEIEHKPNCDVHIGGVCTCTSE